MRSVRYYIKYSLVTLVALVIIGYSALEAKNLFRQDNLTINSPENGTTVDQKLITISGQAKNTASIGMNNLPVFVNEDGFFSIPYILAPGYNIIEVALVTKFDKVEKKTVEVIYKP